MTSDRIKVLESALRAALRHMTHPSHTMDTSGLEDHPIVVKAVTEFEKDLAEVKAALNEQ